MNFNVVIVDDDALVLFLHRTVIERSLLPKNTYGFRNAKDALDFLYEKREKDMPFLVLLDINMPEVNGWDFLKELQDKKFRKKIFVVMVTSSINTADVNKAKSFPQVVDYVEKPLNQKMCERVFHKMQCLLQNPN
ncbi:MAG TPA: response regulator [Salinimicrobium sp.]|nr:response regulator [Salinimicrobium sp.]